MNNAFCKCLIVSFAASFSVSPLLAAPAKAPPKLMDEPAILKSMRGPKDFDAESLCHTAWDRMRNLVRSHFFTLCQRQPKRY